MRPAQAVAALPAGRSTAAAGLRALFRPVVEAASARVPRPRYDVLERVVGPEWVVEHLSGVLAAARSGAASNVLLLRLPASPVVPLTFFEQLAELQEACALAVVVLGAGGGAAAAPSLPGHDGDDLVAVLFGPSACQSTVASRTSDGRYEVQVDTRPERVSALSRQLLGQA